MTSRRCSPSSAAPPLEDDNLLSEILIRLPSEPSSLPRSSLVSKGWHRVASDPRFSRRFRLHHRRNAPLLGFFNDLHFLPTMDSPNRVSEGRFSLRLDHGSGDHLILGCRHGLLLVLSLDKPTGHPAGYPVLVWDPVTGERHRVAVPAAFIVGKTCWIGGAVLRGTGLVHFQVVLLVADKGNGRILAWVYSSETGVWGDPIQTPLPSLSSGFQPFACDTSVLVGDSLYWLLLGSSSRSVTGTLSRILQFDLDRQILGVIYAPPPAHSDSVSSSPCLVLQAGGGGPGFLFVSGYQAQLWNMKTYLYNGAASWVLERTIQLENLLSVNPEKEKVMILGFAENNNVVLVETVIGVFTIQLESLKFKKVHEAPMLSCHHAFESVYAAGIDIGAGDGGAELLHNT